MGKTAVLVAAQLGREMKRIIAVITASSTTCAMHWGASACRHDIEAKGYGRQKGHTEIYRGAEYTVLGLS